MPVIGSKISEAVLNELQSQYGIFGGDFAGFFGSTVFFLLVFMFSYNILTSIVNTLKNTVTRIAGELVEDDRVEAKKSMLDAYPNLRGMYDENDGNTQVFYMKNATATVSSFGAAPVVIEF